MPARGYNIKKGLENWLKGAEKVVIAGIGNPIRMDDFVGVKIVRYLQGKVSDRVFLIECETVPESFIQQIIDFSPSHILLVDAAILKLEPGDSRLASPDKLSSFTAFSTHMLPLRIFCECLTRTKAKIALLLIEPKETGFGEELSHEIQDASQNISNILLELLL